MEVQVLEEKEGKCSPAPGSESAATRGSGPHEFFRFAKSPGMEPASSDSIESGYDGDMGDDNGTLIVMSSAMQNPVILKTLFKQCPVEVLANFRLVSKLWHDLSLPFWRSSVCVTFNQCELFSGTFWADSLSPHCTLHNFCEFVKNPKNKCEKNPYRQFCLTNWEFTRNWNKDLINQFWLTCSNTITSLELYACSFDGAEDFRKVMFSCQNLQQLVVNRYKDRIDQPWFGGDEEDDEDGEPANEVSYGELFHLKSLSIDKDYVKLPWMEVLSHFPRLTTLTLSRPVYSSVVKEMIETINIIRKEDSRKLVLKHLNLELYEGYYISAGMRTLLMELQLPLETLTLDFGAGTPIEFAKEILEIHAPTLRVLKAYRIPSLPYTRFPCEVPLDSLHELYLSDTLSSNMEFVKFTPNLQVLHLRDTADKGPPYKRTNIVYRTWKPELSNVSLAHLTDLRIEYIISEDDIRSLMKWMPNVKKLKMVLNDRQFSIVCGNENWRKLVYLHVYGTELTDEGVSGKIFHVEENGEEKELPLTRPNITCLKDLRTFVMDPFGRVLHTTIMGPSAFHSFLQCESLQDLRIRSHMGDKAEEPLKQKIPHCEFMRTY